MSWFDIALHLAGFRPGGARGLARLDEADNLLVKSVPGLVKTKSVQSAVVGNVLIATPAQGNCIRLSYYAINASPDNADHVVGALRFGEDGELFGVTPMSKYGGGTAHSFKAGESYIEGEVDQAIYGNLSKDQLAYFNIDFEEFSHA